MTGMAILTILIVSHNTRQELEDCLTSLSTHPPRTPHDIVVVDNASTDGTVEALRDRWPRVQVLQAPRNVGFAAANNLGIRAVDSEYVLLLNSDTVVAEHAVDTLAGALMAAPDVAAVGPRLVDGHGRAELSFGRMMTPFNEARQKLLVRLHDRRIGFASRYVERLTRTARDADWVSGACLLVRRRDAVAAGLLDERYFLYAEDVDFCAALRELGKRVRFTPAAQITHLRGRSRSRRPAASDEAYRRSHLAFYAKHHPRWAPWLRWYLRLRGRLPRPVE